MFCQWTCPCPWQQGPTPTGQRGPLLPLPETGLVPPPTPHPANTPPPLPPPPFPNQRLGLGNVYQPPPHPIPCLTSSVWSYRLIRLEVFSAFAHFAWRSHRNAGHTECEGGGGISQEWHSGLEFLLEVIWEFSLQFGHLEIK